MPRNGKLLITILTTVSALAGVALVVYALAGPMARRSQAAELVAQAEAILSPPLEQILGQDEIDCDGAAALLREALVLDSNHGRARRALSLASGCSSLARGDAILAEGELRTASTLMTDDPRPLYWLGVLRLGQGRPADGREHFEAALERDNRHVASLVGLSDALAELGDHSRGLVVLEQIQAEPQAAIETRRGLLLESMGRIEDARAAYELAIDLSPVLPGPHNNLAALEQDAGNLQRAWELQQEALRLQPDDPLLLLNAGLAAIAAGQDERADELLARAGELDPDSPDPIRARADHLLVTGQEQRAVELLSVSTERFSRDGALLNSFGNALAAAGRSEDARRAYRRAIEIDSSLAEPHNGLGALLLGRGDFEQAETELRAAARLDPRNPLIQRNLARLAARRGSHPSPDGV